MSWSKRTMVWIQERVLASLFIHLIILLIRYWIEHSR
ncbi:hypothetical protein AR543_p0036 (plasmid) [Paenibacillus bovis]|uniref:Uncharacterized protein n=1 Tax=Paenibacillus bovis TaxID=1616788 RepID=A0A1X9T422_9BACL|nr:hypothetical protein AR543_p0036 [Paenibacillus bovis]